MIKYSGNTINDWNYNESNINKVCYNNSVVYQKIYKSVPQYDVCYAVVDDISQYLETDFEDVYDKATSKWYKLNNLDQYEEYGVFGSGRTITTYDGKLTIDDGYEYQYSGNTWVNVGEVVEGTIWYDPPSVANENAIFEFGHYWGDGYKMVINTYLSGSFSSQASFLLNTNHSPIEFAYYQNGFYYDMHDPTSTTNPDTYSGDYSYRIMKNGTLNSYLNGQIMNTILTYGTVRVELESTGQAIVTGSTNTGSSKNWYNGLYNLIVKTYFTATTCHFSGLKVYNANDELVNDLKFIKNAGVTGSQEISMYDSVLDATYNNTTEFTPSYHISSGSTPMYPVRYDSKSAPLDDLTFNTMAEANEYAYNNCVYDGMTATIGGISYYFDNGWVKTTSALPDVPYSLNYNAKQYIASAYTIPQTDGQLQNVDAVCNYGYHIVDHSADGYITVTGDSRLICSGNNGTYLARENNSTACTMTIVSKAKTTSGYSILANRPNQRYRQWMYRQESNQMHLCGTGNTTPLSCSDSVPSIMSIKVYYNGGVKASAKNHTNGNILAEESYAYNNQLQSATGGCMFCDYSEYNLEFWQGDFYWVYMSQNVLTDEQIQQVIDYNENL